MVVRQHDRVEVIRELIAVEVPFEVALGDGDLGG